MFAYCNNNPVMLVDPFGFDPVPLWAINIISGNGLVIDYLIARSADSSAWCGYARNVVDEAIELANSIDDNLLNDDPLSFIGEAEHHKKGTTNPSNRNKHQNGQARKLKDKFGEKGDARRKPNPNKPRPKGNKNSSVAEKIASGAIVIGATACVIYFVANDATVIGIADDAAIAPFIPIIIDNATKVFS